jgi:hypothetical protein
MKRTTMKSFWRLFIYSTLIFAMSASLAKAQPASDVILHPADMEQLIPKTVFFRGQTAPVQVRNSGGIKYADGMFFFAALVDTSGYSTSIKAKYQAYFVTEVSIEVGGKHLPPGAYGVGFIADHQFVVMDVGGHDLLTVSDERDERLRRPTPLQVVAGEAAGTYRLYEGREFVTIKRIAE